MNNNIDMGDMTSKEIGELMAKPLVERNKEIIKKMDSNIDYDDMQSKNLKELEKQSFSNNNPPV